jgi:diguanylate cyclase (GGDEF)-like protein
MRRPLAASLSVGADRFLARGVENAPAEVAIRVQRARAFGVIGMAAAFFFFVVSGLLLGRYDLALVGGAFSFVTGAGTYWTDRLDGRAVNVWRSLLLTVLLVGTDLLAVSLPGADPISVMFPILMVLYAAHVFGIRAAAFWTAASCAGLAFVVFGARWPEAGPPISELNIFLVRTGVLLTVFAFAAAARRFQDRQTRELEFLASHDPLTGLLNHSAFELRLHEAVARSIRYERPIALLFVDLDGFKRVNDRWGHAVGDLVLCRTAERIRRHTRATDHAGRRGGDEFVIALEPVADEDTAETYARRLLEELMQPFELASRNIDVSASIGVAIYPGDARDAEGLLTAADQAMYEAKYAGGGTVQLYSDLPDPDVGTASGAIRARR